MTRSTAGGSPIDRMSEADTVEFAAISDTVRFSAISDTVVFGSSADTVQFERITEPAEPSLAKASGSMAVGTLVSRVTGFFSRALLAWVVMIGVVTDSYNVAMTAPLQVYEFLLGGVLTSIVVPLLVRAQKEDADRGEAYTQRLITIATVVMTAATVLAVLAAPLFTSIYMDTSTQGSPALVTKFGYLLLPEIVFFGLSALFMAVLNTRGVFGPTGWAPVANNVVVIATLLVYRLVPGQISVDPVRMGNPKLLVLGIGTTLGIVAQAVVLLPVMRRSGFRFRWRWGWDRRFAEFGGLALWVFVYVVLGLLGIVIITRLATSAAPGSFTTFTYAWQLFVLPYGVLGVSLLTAIMPRMSKAAADDDRRGVVDNFSTGGRLTTVMLLPISAGMTVLAVPLSVALFSHGATGNHSATLIGEALAAMAFGLVPYSLTLLQTRVFYAMKDARTPTMLQLIRVVAGIALSLLCVQLLDPAHVVLGLSFVNSLSYVLSAVAGNWWLHHRLGGVRTARLMAATGKTLAASVVAAAVAYMLVRLIGLLLPAGTPASVGTWLSLLLGSVIGLACAFGLMALFRVEELRPVVDRVRRLARR